MSLFTDALAAAATTSAGITTGPPDNLVRTSWAHVRVAATRMAAVLVERGLRPGQAVAVLAGTPAEIAPAVQAIWLAGGSVTMLHQPTARTDLSTFAHETATVLRVIGARLVVIGAPFGDAAGALAAGGIGVVTVDELDAGAGGDGTAAAFAAPEISEDATALLQLTSGSTATPKAVRITHANLWANLEAMVATADLRSGRDVMISWLPLFHDMGMVGFLTLPMCRGIEVVKVTPADFLRRPLLWPELISRFGGTCTAAPNFAYAITARVLARADDLDLSTLRFALNGAEPIDVAAVQGFLAAGRRFGLPDTAMVPAYGMAEATLGVSFHPWGKPLQIDAVDAQALESDHRAVPVTEFAVPASLPAAPAASMAATSAMAEAEPPDAQAVRHFPVLGPPLPGIEVSVRSENGDELGDRQVGVLHLRGDAVTEEYLTVDGPKPTRGADNWLDTGDLGYLAGGRVVVCGRSKDVIIMGGRNIFPTDIERIAHGVEGVRAGNAAAVRWVTSSGRESFGVVVESRDSDDDTAVARIAEGVRKAVTAGIGARPAAVRVVGVGTLPKTPSGKIRRTAATELLADRPAG